MMSQHNWLASTYLGLYDNRAAQSPNTVEEDHTAAEGQLEAGPQSLEAKSSVPSRFVTRVLSHAGQLGEELTHC